MPDLLVKSHENHIYPEFTLIMISDLKGKFELQYQKFKIHGIHPSYILLFQQDEKIFTYNWSDHGAVRYVVVSKFT